MQPLTWLSYLLVAVVAVAKDAPKKLMVVSTYTPDECTRQAKKGDNIQVHYSGRLFSDGTKFDSSYDRDSPLPIMLGVGQVIRGWDEGLVGMCVGEKRTLTIPSDMAYGSRGAGGLIPPNSALIFDVELVSLEGSGHRQEL